MTKVYLDKATDNAIELLYRGDAEIAVQGIEQAIAEFELSNSGWMRYKAYKRAIDVYFKMLDSYEILA